MSERAINLRIRLLSAAILLPVVLYCLYLGRYAFAGVLSVAACLCAYEYLRLTIGHNQASFWRSPPVLVALVAAFVAPVLPVAAPTATAPIMVALAGGVFAFGWTWHMLFGSIQDGPTRTAHLLTSFVYGAGGLTALCALRQFPEGGWWTVSLLVITWANDTSAYFGGRLLGKHKLAPSLSPNKTWEGFAAGFIGPFVLLMVQRAVFSPFLTVVDCVLLTLGGGIIGPIGDLCESMLKRSVGAKDSGNAIPGHGGMLDRIDSLIFNAPMVLAYVAYLRPAL